ncbi:MAG TPA: four helix bundle protein [Anaerolineae bacterium]|nr:four helix bundle protein [Anaerolineae bacterium]
MAIKSYHDLEAYQRAKKLIPLIYQLVETFPADERFDLCDQMRRACKSVVDNIVEGYSHKDTPTKAKAFWRNSMGSANEMVEHLEQSVTLKYATSELAQPMINEYTIVAKQLNRLIQNWRKL